MRLTRSFASKHRPGLWWLAVWFPFAAAAFPPAPPHLIYGVVRDSLGYPLGDGAEVILEAASGAHVRAFVLAEVDSAINYRLQVPMDAGLTEDVYAPTALMPAAPFRLRVRVGNTSFLPIEMTADFSTLGAPGGRTRIDLTLGVDADGNGLPDAWEKAVADYLGRVWRPGQIDPNAAYPGTGLTYREVYLAGTYAMEPKDGFALQLVVAPGQPPKLAFTAVKGRTYTLQSAAVLGQWTTTPFRVLPAGTATAARYQAVETRRVEIEAPLVDGAPAQFYRLLVE